MRLVGLSVSDSTKTIRGVRCSLSGGIRHRSMFKIKLTLFFGHLQMIHPRVIIIQAAQVHHVKILDFRLQVIRVHCFYLPAFTMNYY